MAKNPYGMALLDPGHVTKTVYDPTNDALRISQIGGTLVPEDYDYIDIHYVDSGNGAGQPDVITYKLGGSSGSVVATITISYDAQNNPVTVTKI